MTEHNESSADQESTPASPTPEDGAPGYASDGVPDDGKADEIVEFWEAARASAHLDDLGVVTGHSALGSVAPQSWSFGDNPDLADRLLAEVLDGRKTATSTALVEFEDEDEPLPREGDLSIILDGQGRPRALIRTTSVTIVAFRDVVAEFAAAEGEDDGSLAAWQDSRRAYFTRVLGDRFSEDMSVVCERFELRFPR